MPFSKDSPVYPRILGIHGFENAQSEGLAYRLPFKIVCWDIMLSTLQDGIYCADPSHTI